jgi:hypothetical protein
MKRWGAKTLDDSASRTTIGQDVIKFECLLILGRDHQVRKWR